MRKVALCWISALGLLSVALAGQAQTNSIDFDDGSVGAPIGAYYAARGVTMSNAVWAANMDVRGNPFAGCSGQFVLWAQNGGSAPSSQTPIVAKFPVPLKFVAITASDIGLAGARIEAYDAEIGGNLIGSDELFGSGVGFDVYRELQVATGGIRRIHLFQPNPNGSDGLVWDNLRFASSDAATLDVQMYAGLRIEGTVGCRYRIDCAGSVESTNWTSLTNVTLTTSPFFWFDMNSPSQTKRFYRAVSQ